ncbi:MAG TPA: hypothetical protein VLL97_15190 [Acidobacteriota bacterium]|nr:hypothetical protein [Acidobacteriota bacterium]
MVKKQKTELARASQKAQATANGAPVGMEASPQEDTLEQSGGKKLE